MFIRALVFAVVSLGAVASAVAGRAGGHVTTFDANLFPGQVTKNFITEMGATCNGVASDTAAVTTFRNFAITQNPACVVLYIPPGSKCRFPALVGSFSWDGTSPSVGASCIRVWSYGASLTTDTGIYLGANGFIEDSAHEAFIQNANAGDTLVTLVTAADSAIFTVGDWVAITGLELQPCCGFPPNFQRYDYRAVTSINGTTTKTLGLSSPLSFAYLSNWPSVQSDASMGNNGPAKIFKLNPAWNVDFRIYGGTSPVVTAASSQDYLVGRTVAVYDAVFGSVNTSATVGGTINLFGTSSSGMEIDKDIELLSMHRSLVGGNLTFQSPAPITFVGTSLTVLGSINGTPWNASFTGGRVSGLTKLGPSGFYGVGNSIAFDGIATPTGAMQANLVLKSDADPLFSAGTFTVAKASSTVYQAFLRWGIPGHKYAFADSDGTINSSPVTTFTVTSVVDNGTTVSFNTDIGGALPTPTCNAHACLAYVAYPAATITQKNSPAGSADLTQYAAP